MSGDSITPKYKINRSSSWTSGTAVTTVGDTRAVLYINSLFREIEFGFDLSTSANTYPKVIGIEFIYDLLEDESTSA